MGFGDVCFLFSNIVYTVLNYWFGGLYQNCCVSKLLSTCTAGVCWGGDVGRRPIRWISAG